MIDFQDIRTELGLLRRLAIVAPRKMSSEEMKEQRISFIFRQMGGRLSKAEIEVILDKQEGRA